MAFLLLRIVFTVAFSHLLRFSQARTRRPLLAATVNYGMAGLACSLWAGATGSLPHWPTLVLGALAGFTYVTSLVMMLPAMRKSGVSVTGAVVQLSMMAPVPVAILRFGEYPNAWQTVGIVLTLVALPLLSASSAVQTSQSAGRFSFLIVWLFLSTSTSQVVMKEFSTTRPAADLPVYSAALFLSATFFTWLWMTRAAGSAAPAEPETRQEERKLVGEWPLGTVMGVANVLQLVFLLLALRVLPAVIVFPVSASLGIVANVLAAMAIWKERPPPAGWVGIGMAIIAVVLLNLKG